MNCGCRGFLKFRGFTVRDLSFDDFEWEFCELHKAIYNPAAIKALVEAAKFSLSVHKAQGMFDLSEQMAVEKLEQALAAVKKGK